MFGAMWSTVVSLGDVAWRWGPDTVDIFIVPTAAGAGAVTATCLVVITGFDPPRREKWPAYGTLIGAGLGLAAWLILGVINGFEATPVLVPTAQVFDALG